MGFVAVEIYGPYEYLLDIISTVGINNYYRLFVNAECSMCEVWFSFRKARGLFCTTGLSFQFRLDLGNTVNRQQFEFAAYVVYSINDSTFKSFLAL